MRSTVVCANGGTTHVLVFDRGDEAMGGLESFACEHGLSGGSFTGIGAFSEVVLMETPAELRKALDPESGLALIAPGTSGP
jgi:predicted DNA-binding protein with PD1-like motif